MSLTRADIDQINEGIELFIIGPQFTRDLRRIWQPYKDKLDAVLPPNWTIVTCPKCGDPVFAELGVIRLHGYGAGTHRCAGSGWMMPPEPSDG